MASKTIPGVHEDGDIDWPLAFPLKRPIKAFDDEYSALTIQEPNGTHAVKYSLFTRGLSDDTVAPLIADLTSIPEASILKMAASDLMKITAILARFFVQAVD